MHLIHTTFEENILNILKDGYLRSSSQTKNVKMFGQEQGSKYIYLRLNKKNDYGNFILDEDLLLKNNFYLKTGWSGEAFTTQDKIYKGDTLSKLKLKILLKKFNTKINNYFKLKKKEKFPIPILMSNEILLTKKIPLKKYLIQINISKYDKDICSYVEKNYPHTKIFYPDQK